MIIYSFKKCIFLVYNWKITGYSWMPKILNPRWKNTWLDVLWQTVRIKITLRLLSVISSTVADPFLENVNPVN